MIDDTKPDQPTPPSRLTPEQIAQVTGEIAAHGQQQASQPAGEPSALTPAKIEELMRRTVLDGEIAGMCSFKRPADATVDAGEHDLIPLANVISQVSRQGPEAFSITVMYAAWALATYHRTQQVEGGL